MARVALFVGLLLASGSRLTAQQGADTARASSEGLRVFLDCTSFFCDFDYFRQQIQFVNWVRDRRDADVHVLGTSQQTGGGGREFTLTFIGLRSWQGRVDTLRYNSRQTDTEDENRAGLVRVVSLGLVRYAAATSLAARLGVSYTAPTTQARAGPVHDPWNYWVFRTRIGMDANGESKQSFYSVNSSASANRTTEALKLSFSLNGRYSRSRFEIDSTNTFISTSKNYNLDLLSVWSLGPHWSFGMRGGGGSSTFVNQKLSWRFGPAVELDAFRYSESTRRQLTFEYSMSVTGYRYEEETIFDRTSEARLTHRLEVGISARQPWGSVSGSVNASQYLHDLSKHQISLFSGISLRLVKGLAFNLFGNVARIKDQLFLAKGGLSAEEILVRRRQLGTDFRYFVNFGFSYTFGSIYNNIVNPRMGDGGGFFFFD